MDIYFAGSIRGGRDDAALYADLIDALERHGTVLTEHVGTADVEEREEAVDLSDREIHDQDLEWLRRADVVVAEVTTPSLGVGYEVGRAVAWEKPVCCLYRPDSAHDLSAMIRGNAAVDVLEYQTPSGVESELEAFLESHH
ncbi:nucleoside 2-deoxyribosyltransferase [Natronolimnohabitans innermongolicus]|uniref:Putative 2'-deoxynucleoside 5'-phosphate N-hydrolase 1 n=1 Tax=Natronolimnohabitans innermongolicus JCM 12255 TaxID=1227499 RepID=L9X022_9EURY|nr:nucleoside 2-deoxyribosyltransferase [Natronolimnohabitans innermongolicus]ELY55045.1 nucleoside 2-deoxyribosyltransferase [Natronolimnohabitans innermongolicus JCM 12255]